jgi:hypothetical protein
MNAEDFNELVLARLTQCEETLCRKAGEYASDEDRLHNFKAAGRVLNISPIAALRGMKVKHDVSVDDICNRMEADPLYVPSKELLAEKIGDIHNYDLLLEGLIEDRRSALRNEM